MQMMNQKSHYPLLDQILHCFLLLVCLAVHPVTAQEQPLANPFEYLPPHEEVPRQVVVENSNPTKVLDESPNPLPPVNELPEQGEQPAVFAEIEQPQAELPVVERRVADGNRGDDVLTRKFNKAYVIDVEGPIFGKFHWYLNHRLDAAQQAGADVVIIRLTSPGGDLEFSLQLGRRLRDLDWATTVVLIPEEAISGGAIIALGCERIYMLKGALIGDAGPIRMGMGGQFEHAEEKIVSYLASAIRELAIAKDRPAALAEAMVDRSLVVYAATERATGKSVYLTEKQIADVNLAARYDVGAQVPESGQNRFLTLDAVRAVELGLSEGVFQSEAEMLEKLSFSSLERTKINWVDHVVYLLNRPWLTAILLIAGLVGLYLELIAPGISVAGLGALCCFSVFFWSHFLGGTAGWLEVTLFGLGIVCCMIELFALPGFGVFGISGLGLIVVALVMASQKFLLPSSALEWQQLQTNLLIVLGSVLGVLILFISQIVLFDSLPGASRFRLAAPEADGVAETESLTLLTRGPGAIGQLAAVGETGQAASDLRPSGKVLIEDRLIDVITEGDYVDAGTPIEVLRVEGNRVLVRKII
jgi:membrane-bound serine protease (ClpP class)